jgi:aspartyl-tRNA(Asn)/glutamyl-tRNA(Gln) amidotransferase subunit B
MSWDVVIGLEIHAQLATRTKIFSGAATAYGAEPNRQACAVDLAFPGVLPVLNERAVEFALRFGLAIGAHLNMRSVFARKNYFYPDLPKGYQISQFELPIVGRGEVSVVLDDGSEKRVGVTRAHLEEDAGKSLHELFPQESGIDLNRAGTPLLEIVSEPDLRNAREAVAYMKTIHSLVRYLEICDGNMQEGSLRCDANVSVRPGPDAPFGTRVEIKNLNSFRYIERAINFEVERQVDLIESGGKVRQETRLYDSAKDETRPLRSKEEANDYRYFPDPDLLPLVVSTEQLERVRAALPELPDQKRLRFERDYQLSNYDARVLTATREIADYYEAVVEALGGSAKLAANWVMGDVLGAVNRCNLDIEACPISPATLALMLTRILDDTISGKSAKDLFELLWSGETDVDGAIASRGLKQLSDSTALRELALAVMAENPEQVIQYRAGKDKLLGFFVGQVMKRCGGTANPGQLNELLKQVLSESA